MSSWILANLSKHWGGGENWTLTAALALKASGHSVFLITYPNSALSDKASHANLSFHPIKARAHSLLNPQKIFQIWRIFKTIPCDVLILNSSHELKFLGLIAKLAKIPHVVFRRGIPQPLGNHYLNHWYMAHVVTGMVVNSRATLLAMQSVFRQEMALLPVQVVYNGIDLKKWTKIKIDKSGKIIGIVGRLTYEKGVDRALFVFSEILKNMSDVELWVIGDGEERKNLEQQAIELEINGSVRFWGFQEEVKPILEKFDILLLPSRWEGFGYVLLEAMSLEVPPVAFNIDAAREILTEESGVLIPDGQIEECATAILRLLKDDKVRLTMGKHGRNRVETMFSMNSVVQQLEKILE